MPATFLTFVFNPRKPLLPGVKKSNNNNNNITYIAPASCSMSKKTSEKLVDSDDCAYNNINGLKCLPEKMCLYLH